jgi:hypothetical protein
MCIMPSWMRVGWAMQDPLDRADHYRKEAVKCHELAKCAQPAFLADFYRRIAVRYMFMAEDVEGCASKRRRRAAESSLSITRFLDGDLWIVGNRTCELRGIRAFSARAGPLLEEPC